MQPFYCPKSKYHCAWCSGRNTTIVLNNQHQEEDHKLYSKKKWDDGMRKTKMDIHMKDFYPRTYTDSMFPFKPQPFPDFPDEMRPPQDFPGLDPFYPNRFKKLPLNVIIRCNDCYKFTNVKEVRCKQCKKTEVITVRISSTIDPDEVFEPKLMEEHICSSCKYSNSLPPPCDHEWVKHSGEIFSECTAINLYCRFCGAKKVRYSNDDRDYDFYW